MEGNARGYPSSLRQSNAPSCFFTPFNGRAADDRSGSYKQTVEDDHRRDNSKGDRLVQPAGSGARLDNPA